MLTQRPSAQPPLAEGQILLPGFVVDIGLRELLDSRGKRVAIRKQALDVLLMLAERPGQVVHRDEIMRRVWPSAIVSDDSLMQAISEIRRKLLDKNRTVVRSVARRGYVLEAAAASLNAPATNLISSWGALVGRESDLAQASGLLSESRLLTIVGPGGIGKTRLALDLAKTRIDSFSHGVWWVDLATATNAAKAALAIATSVRIELPQDDPVASLPTAFAQRQLLLVLDNCEHIVAEVGQLAAALLDQAAEVRILATSQSPLHIAREHVYRLDALDLPAPQCTLAQARTYAAFQLLERRAAEADHRFALREGDAEAAVQICRSLEGLPLAIEMAAARLPALGAETVRSMLESQINALRNPGHLVPQRQQTLRQAVQWSCGLLQAAEQAALRRLAVFRADFDRTAALTVVAAGDLDAQQVDDALTGVVERSLVKVARSQVPRYRLLEPIRQYATELLEAAGETMAARDRHARAMVQVALDVRKAAWEIPDAEVLDRFNSRYTDMDLALAHVCEQGDVESAAELLDGMYRLDLFRSTFASARGRILAVIPLLPKASPSAKARIDLVIATCPWVNVDGLSAAQAADEAVAALRTLNDRRNLCLALSAQMIEASKLGRYQVALAAVHELTSLLATLPRSKSHVIAEIALAHAAKFRRDGKAYLEHLHSALALAKQTGSDLGIGQARMFLTDAALLGGDAAQALRIGQETVHELRQLGQRGYLLRALVAVQRAAIALDDKASALQAAAEALPLAREFGTDAGLWDCLAMLASMNGLLGESLCLAGIADQRLASIHKPRSPERKSYRDAVQAAADAVLATDQIDTLLQQGRGMSGGEPFEYAASVLGMLAQG